MKKIILLSLITVTLTLISCGEDALPIPITFVFDQPLPEGKYPSYFKDITEPFSGECGANYLLKPINVARIDIKKAPVETNAWYFEQMGDNTVEFSKNWLSQFFKDSLVVEHLTLPSKRKVNENAIDGYLSKDDILTLIYSEESDQDIYNEIPIYTSPKEVTNKIRQGLCNNTYKEVVLIINPSKLAQSTSITGVDEDVVGATATTNKYPCNQPTVNGALDINDAIAEIINTNKTLTERVNEAEDVWKKYCHPNAYVALFKNKDDESIDVWDPGSGKNYFTNRLAILESIVSTSIFRIELANDGKISGIHIIECQNANELL